MKPTRPGTPAPLCSARNSWNVLPRFRRRLDRELLFLLRFSEGAGPVQRGAAAGRGRRCRSAVPCAATRRDSRYKTQRGTAECAPPSSSRAWQWLPGAGLLGLLRRLLGAAVGVAVAGVPVAVARRRWRRSRGGLLRGGLLLLVGHVSTPRRLDGIEGLREAPADAVRSVHALQDATFTPATVARGS